MLVDELNLLGGAYIREITRVICQQTADLVCRVCENRSNDSVCQTQRPWTFRVNLQVVLERLVSIRLIVQ